MDEDVDGNKLDTVELFKLGLSSLLFGLFRSELASLSSPSDLGDLGLLGESMKSMSLYILGLLVGVSSMS